MIREEINIAIENFILYAFGDEKERESMMKILDVYQEVLEEDEYRDNSNPDDWEKEQELLQYEKDLKNGLFG